MNKRGTILLVEDNPTNLILFQDVLESRGYEVHIAKNGYEALDLLNQCMPDLILMDIHMPELDGLSVTRSIRSSSQYNHIKIIGLSALAMEADIDKAMQAGCNGYITKPVSISSFVAEIEKYLNGDVPESN